MKKHLFSQRSCAVLSSVEARRLSGDNVSRRFVLPGGALDAGCLTGCCLTDRFTRGIDSQRGLVTEPGGNESHLVPRGWLMAARDPLKLACCAV